MEWILLLREIFESYELPVDVSQYTLYHYMAPFVMALKEEWFLYSLSKVLYTSPSSLRSVNMLRHREVNLPSTEQFYVSWDSLYTDNIPSLEDALATMYRLMFDSNTVLKLKLDIRIRDGRIERYIRLIEDFCAYQVAPANALPILYKGLALDNMDAFVLLSRSDTRHSYPVRRAMIEFIKKIDMMTDWSSLAHMNKLVSYALEIEELHSLLVEWLIIWPSKTKNSPFYYIKDTLTPSKVHILDMLRERQASDAMKERRIRFIIQGK